MAVTRAGNVIKLTADNDSVAEALSICSIKVRETAGATATVTLKKGSTSGVVVWEHALAANGQQFDEVEIRLPAAGIWLDLSGAADVYLYLE